MMLTVLTLCVLYCLCVPVISGAVSVCNFDCTEAMSLNCSEMQSITKGRCCLRNDTTDINDKSYTGIDLSNCNLSNITNLFHGMENLKVLYIQGNNIKSLNVEDFVGVLQLEVLKLPNTLDCPGGREMWRNITSDDHVTTCSGEESTCEVFNVTCPNSNSYCQDVAPRMTECLCSPGFYGYKCLRQSTFPTAYFVIGICVGTVLTSGLLWFTQRRHAKKNV